MAISSVTQWEVRTTGSDSNGGGFVAGASGTDYSQQDSAQFSGTNLVVDASVNTKVTSASHNFVSTDVGNLINVSSGSGWTPGCYQIVSVASNAATLDRSPAATSTTGGVWALGGAMATLGTAVANWVPQNNVWMKKGTYTRATALVISGVQQNTGGPANCIFGYNATRGDNPTGSNRPKIQWTAADQGINFSESVSCIVVANIIFDGTGVGYRGLYISQNAYVGVVFVNCRWTNWTGGTTGPSGVGGAIFLDNYGPTLIACEIDNCPTNYAAVFTQNFPIYMIDCDIHDNTGHGIAGWLSPNWATFIRCASYRNTGSPFGNLASGFMMKYQNNLTFMESCIAFGNAGNGLDASSNFGTTFRNCIFSSNGQYGAYTVAQNVGRPDNNYNAFYANTSGARSGTLAGPNDVILTADPFTNASLSGGGAADFSLNNTAGGGAALKALGFPGLSPSGLSTGYLDIGAYQHQDAGGGGGGGGIAKLVGAGGGLIG
jgi:hypothetical protein